MARKSKTLLKTDYRGSKIEIVSRDVTDELKIDGKAVSVSRDADTGAYLSDDIPYQTYGTLEELGKAAVDARKDEELVPTDS